MLPPHSAAVPKTIEELEALLPALKARLFEMPEVWTENDVNTLSVLEQDAHFLLIASGFVEEWSCFRLKMISEDYAIEAEVKFTGSGIEMPLNQVLLTIYAEKQAAIDAIKTATNGYGHVREDVGAGKYRLSKHGASMRRRFQAAEASTDDELRTRFACEFHASVIKQVPGYGMLVRAEKISATSSKVPPVVEVANWPKEVTQVVPQLMEEILGIIQKREDPPLPEFTDWLPPDSWMKWLAENGRPNSPTKWLEFKRSHDGQDHSQSGNRLVRFPTNRLLEDGLQPPTPATAR